MTRAPAVSDLSALRLVASVLLALLAGCREPAPQQTAQTTEAGQDAQIVPDEPTDGASASATVPVTVSFQPASDRPLYAALRVSQDGSRIMRLMLDESQGAGKGYDVLFADADLDGTIGADERFAAQRAESSGDFTYASFQPVQLPTRYAEPAADSAQADMLGLTYVRAGSGAREQLYASLQVAMGREGQEPWVYGLSGNPAIARSPGEVVVWDTGGTPALRVATEAGERGSLGVAVVASVGDAEVMCPQATVEAIVRTPEGREVARDEGRLMDFGFG